VAGGKWPTATGDGDFAVYLAHQPAASTELFWRFVELARGCGAAWLSEAREVGDGFRGSAAEDQRASALSMGAKCANGGTAAPGSFAQSSQRRTRQASAA
jgi:hypothetical protein